MPINQRQEAASRAWQEAAKRAGAEEKLRDLVHQSMESTPLDQAEQSAQDAIRLFSEGTSGRPGATREFREALI